MLVFHVRLAAFFVLLGVVLHASAAEVLKIDLEHGLEAQSARRLDLSLVRSSCHMCSGAAHMK